MGIGWNFQRQALANRHTIGFEFLDLVRIVGQQANRLNAQGPPHLGPKLVFPGSSRLAQGEVGFQSIQPCLLQVVGLEFVD